MRGLVLLGGALFSRELLGGALPARLGSRGLRMGRGRLLLGGPMGRRLGPHAGRSGMMGRGGSLRRPGLGSRRLGGGVLRRRLPGGSMFHILIIHKQKRSFNTRLQRAYHTHNTYYIIIHHSDLHINRFSPSYYKFILNKILTQGQYIVVTVDFMGFF